MGTTKDQDQSGKKGSSSTKKVQIDDKQKDGLGPRNRIQKKQQTPYEIAGLRILHKNNLQMQQQIQQLKSIVTSLTQQVKSLDSKLQKIAQALTISAQQANKSQTRGNLKKEAPARCDTGPSIDSYSRLQSVSQAEQAIQIQKDCSVQGSGVPVTQTAKQQDCQARVCQGHQDSISRIYQNLNSASQFYPSPTIVQNQYFAQDYEGLECNSANQVCPISSPNQYAEPTSIPSQQTMPPQTQHCTLLQNSYTAPQPSQIYMQSQAQCTQQQSAPQFRTQQYSTQQYGTQQYSTQQQSTQQQSTEQQSVEQQSAQQQIAQQSYQAYPWTLGIAPPPTYNTTSGQLVNEQEISMRDLSVLFQADKVGKVYVDAQSCQPRQTLLTTQSSVESTYLAATEQQSISINLDNQIYGINEQNTQNQSILPPSLSPTQAVVCQPTVQYSYSSLSNTSDLLQSLDQ